jgi:N-methylhydantoinase A
VLHIFEHTEIMQTPLDASRINGIFSSLEKRAKQTMAGEGIAESRQRFEFSLDVRHKGQINEVEVLLPSTRLALHYENDLRKRFVGRYEQLYGRGSALAGAILEIVVCRLRARALTPRPRLARAKKTSSRIPVGAVRKKRNIYWPDLKKKRQTVVYDGERLVSGNSVTGPAIVETSDTTVVVPPGAKLRLDRLGNFELTF